MIERRRHSSEELGSQFASIVRQRALSYPHSFSFSISGLTVQLTDIPKQIPLAYLVEQAYTHLGNQGRAYEQTDRFGPGHIGPAYPEDSCVRAAPRLGDWATPETGFWRHPAGQRRVAIPCPAQAGAGGLDHGRVEAERE